MNSNDILSGWTSYFHQLPNLLFALLVLLIGWLIAKGIGRSVEALLKKTSLDDKLFSDFGKLKHSSEEIIGKVVYYLLLVVVWIIFFNMLSLSFIATPFVEMLSVLTGAIPNVLKAALILLFALAFAMILRLAVKKAVALFLLESVLVKWKIANDQTDAENKVNSTAKAVFYFVLLLFIPGVLGALQIDGVTEPFQETLASFLLFIPKLASALLVLFIGWLIAKIVRDMLTNFLQSVGTEKLGEKAGLQGTNLAAILGNLVFVLILIPTVITALEKLELRGISDPAIAMLQDVLVMIPNVAVAVVLILAGLWLGKWVGNLVAQLLEGLALNRIFEQMGIGSLQSKYSLSQLVGLLVKIVIVLLFTVEALQLVHLDFLVVLATGVIQYLPMLFAALVILGVGLYLGNLVERLLPNILKNSYSRTLALAAKYAIFTISIFMALDQLGVAETIVNAAFILVLGGLALAFGLAFGLGGREFAAKYLGKLDEKVGDSK